MHELEAMNEAAMQFLDDIERGFAPLREWAATVAAETEASLRSSPPSPSTCGFLEGYFAPLAQAAST